MDKVAIGIGLALAVVGIGGFAASETHAPTALIPAYVGAVLALLGVVVMVRPGARKHAMHAGAAVALLGFLGAGWRLVKGFAGGAGPSRLAQASQGATVVLCGLFLVMAIRSFRAARRAREAGAGS